MSDESILNSVRLPARIDGRLTARLLGFQEHDVPVLVRAKMLKPLGNPAPNAPKYFASSEIQELMENRNWLSKATKTVSQNWQRKNARQRRTSAISIAASNLSETA